MKSILLACVCFLAVGCGSMQVAADGPINSECPFAGEAVTADSPSVTFEGSEVAFCCARCASKFDAMADDQKRQQIEKILAAK